VILKVLDGIFNKRFSTEIAEKKRKERLLHL